IADVAWFLDPCVQANPSLWFLVSAPPRPALVRGVHAAEARGLDHQLAGREEVLRPFAAAGVEAEHAAEPLHLTGRHRVGGIVGQAGIPEARHVVTLGEQLGERQRAGLLPLEPYV